MKNLLRPLVTIFRPLLTRPQIFSSRKLFSGLTHRPRHSFSDSINQLPPSSPADIPKQNLKILHDEVQLGEQTVDTFATLGSLSVLSKIKGTKNSESGELYVLMFTCAPCNTRSIRSFTKNAYHHGVVLIRCENCKKIHLVADNLKWFQDQPTNLDDLVGKENVKKVVDTVAIAKFLNAAFGENEQKLRKISQQSEIKKNTQPETSQK